MKKLLKLEMDYLKSDVKLHQAGIGFHEDLFIRFLRNYRLYQREVAKLKPLI